MPIRLLTSHPRTGKNFGAVTCGPIVYTAESVHNPDLADSSPHFGGLGLRMEVTDESVRMGTTSQGIEIVYIKL